VQLFNGTSAFEIRKVTLGPGDTLAFDESGLPWVVLNEASARRAIGTSDQSLTASTLTAIAGGVLDASSLKVGTVLRWRFVMNKTAAGVAAQTFDVRFGTLGTTADTARITGFTTGTQTAAADVAEVLIAVVVRSVSASGVVHGKMNLSHNLAATGFAPTANVVMQATSAAFDNTTAGLKATCTTTSGASSVTTINQVESERLDP
jgi:hypothetical protein